MSPKARRGVGALLLVAVVGGIGAFLVLGGGQAQQADPPRAEPPPVDSPREDDKLKRFQWGIELGKERAGFSGLPMIQIFVDERVDKAALDACLESPGIKELMPKFTGILILPEDEDASPGRLRRKSEHQVIVRRVNGKILGILGPDFTCEELHTMLEESLRNIVGKPKRSPLYRRLLKSPQPIDQMIEAGKADRARRFVDFLKELEGKDHPAAVAAEARLAGR